MKETEEDEKRSERLKEFIRENGEIFMRCSSLKVHDAKGIDAIDFQIILV